MVLLKLVTSSTSVQFGYKSEVPMTPPQVRLICYSSSQNSGKCLQFIKDKDKRYRMNSQMKRYVG